MNNTLSELNKVFVSVFGTELRITPESDTDSVAGWDSLTHMMLISETEKHFSIIFTFHEIMGFHSAGDIVRVIDKHLGK